MKTQFYTQTFSKSLKVAALIVLSFSTAISNISAQSNINQLDSSLSTNESPYQLTIYVVPSTEWLGWNSPLALMKNTAWNKIFPVFPKKKKRAIGHVFVELTDGNYRFFGGMTTQGGNHQMNKVMKEGYNLGILFAEFPGALDCPKKLQIELDKRCEDGEIAFMTFKLHKDNFERLKEYVEQYKQREYHLIYNGKNQPRRGQGAGCSAFGISCLEVAGLLQADWKEEWTMAVRVPAHLVGGPSTGQKVPVLSMLFANRWANEDEPHLVLELYEPYLIHEWIVNQTKQTNKPSNMKTSMNEKALGLSFDYTQVLPPSDPIFLD
ncbi:MAG: hypothetical protein IPI60_12600 [Saprospiraceae bacterium]|nr:hypothetical protein [Saprospiraceae bacterium]